MAMGLCLLIQSTPGKLYAQQVEQRKVEQRRPATQADPAGQAAPSAPTTEIIQVNAQTMNDYDHLVFSFVTPGSNPTAGQNFLVDTYLGGEQSSIRGASMTILFDGALMDYVSFNRNVFPGIWIGNNPQLFSAATEENYITRDISTFGSGALATAPGNSGRITMTAVANGTSPLLYWDDYQGASNINPKIDLELQPSVITQVLRVNAINSTVTIGPAQTELTDGSGTSTYNTLRDSFGVIGDGTHTGTIAVDITDKQYVMQSVSLPASGTGAADYNSVTASVKSGASLRIYEGGTLTMGENQHLVVEDGASLTVDDGASLVIGNGATFSVAGTATFDDPITAQKLISKPDFDNLPGDNTQGLWVALSSPVQGNYSGTGGLLDGLWTQGFPGADSGTGGSNVLVYDETQGGGQLDRYLAPESNSITPGQGFIVYLYEFPYVEGGLDTENPIDYTTPLSITGALHATDAENDFTFSVTNENDGYNLLGNPYSTALSWDLSEGSGKWEASGVEPFAYVLNPATQQFVALESGGGQKSMPGILSTAVIDPFDAFWVIANSETPSLKVKEEAFVTTLSGRVLVDAEAEAGSGSGSAVASGSGALSGSAVASGSGAGSGSAVASGSRTATGSATLSDPSQVENHAEMAATTHSSENSQPAFTLTLSAQGMEAHTGFRFDESFEDGLSGTDARYFSPLGRSFLYLFSRVDEEAVMLNSLDLADGWTTEIPLVAGGYLDGLPLESLEGAVEAEIRLNMMEGLPDTWNLLLRDEVTGMEYDLREEGVVRFDVGGGAVASASTRQKTNMNRSSRDGGAEVVMERGGKVGERLGIVGDGPGKVGERLGRDGELLGKVGDSIEDTALNVVFGVGNANSLVMQADLFSDRFTLTIEQREEENQPLTPESISLYQNFPNPFNPSTVISFDLDTGGVVDLTIYNVDGREVANVLSERRSAGYHEVTFDGQGLGLASGLYFYRLRLTSDLGSSAVQVRKMTLLK